MIGVAKNQQVLLGTAEAAALHVPGVGAQCENRRPAALDHSRPEPFGAPKQIRRCP